MIKAELRLTDNPMPRIEGLKRGVQKRAMARGIKKALDPIKQEARSNAPVRYGFLRLALWSKAVIYKEAGAGVVGPRSKFVREKGTRTRGKHKGQAISIRPSQYLHLVEKGSKTARAQPFLGPTVEKSKDKFAETVADSIKAEIEAVLNR